MGIPSTIIWTSYCLPYILFLLFSAPAPCNTFFLFSRFTEIRFTITHTAKNLKRKISYIITAILLLYTMRKRKDKFELVCQGYYGIMSFEILKFGLSKQIQTKFTPNSDQIQTYFGGMVRIWTISENSDESRCSA